MIFIQFAPKTKGISIYTRLQPLYTRLWKQPNAQLESCIESVLPAANPRPDTIIFLKENDSWKWVWYKSLIAIEETA